MAAFTDLLRGLLHVGAVRLRQFPIVRPDEKHLVLALLESSFDEQQLNLGGPPLAFVPPVALAAAEFTTKACWYLLHRSEESAKVEQGLRLPPPPRTAADHLSADVSFRFLPTVYRRARVLNPQDVLTTRLGELLRSWPLSGVLASIDDPPLTPIDFGGHHGLSLLYAERLAANPRPTWVVDGLVGEFIELVAHEHGIRG